MCRYHDKKLIVEGPRDTQLKHSWIKRVAGYLECFAVTKQALVEVLVLEKDSHTLPLSRDEGIDVWVVTHLYQVENESKCPFSSNSLYGFV